MTLRPARRRADRLRKRGVAHINAYECQLCGYFYIGKLPRAVVKGIIGRDEIVNRSEEERRMIRTAKNRRGKLRARERRRAARAADYVEVVGSMQGAKSSQMLSSAPLASPVA